MDLKDDQQISEHGFRDAEAAESKGSFPKLLLPVGLLFRPGRFFLSWGIHTHVFIFLAAAWIVGSGRMANWVMGQQRLDAEPLPFKIESWTMLWLVLLGLGLGRGILEYGLGGLWTWLRLRICGVRGNQWHRSTRIYTYSRLVEMVPSLMLIAYFSMRYSGLREFIDQPVGLGNFLVGIFMFISPIVAFVGVIACYRVRKVWATILFLIWPVLWRIAPIAGTLAYIKSTNPYMGPYPDIQNPVAASTGVLDFEYPNDWEVSFPDEPVPIEARVDAGIEGSSLVIRVQPREMANLIEYDLEQLRSAGYTIIEAVPVPNVRIEHQSGNGVDYKIRLDGKDYKMFHLMVSFDVDHDVLFRLIATERYWWHAMEGWKQILRTISIGDLYKIKPDIENPMPIETKEFTFQSPGNWHFGEIDGSFYKTVEISAKQYSWITFSIYDRDLSADKELDMYLKHSIDDELISYTKMNSWLGLQGVGAKGKLRETLAGDRQFKVLFVPLADGKILVIKKYQAQSSAQLTDPGFELIESTFKLLVEPASTEP